MLKISGSFTDKLSIVRRLVFASAVLPQDTPQFWVPLPIALRVAVVVILPLSWHLRERRPTLKTFNIWTLTRLKVIKTWQQNCSLS